MKKFSRFGIILFITLLAACSVGNKEKVKTDVKFSKYVHAFTGGEILTAEIQKLIPMIQQKRPRLLENIVKFGTTPLEILLEEGMRTGYPNR